MKKLLVAATVAASLVLTGCAGTGGITGSIAGDSALQTGALGGLVAGAGCAITGGKGSTCAKVAAAGALVGGAYGYAKGLDEQRAIQMQAMIRQQTGMQAQLQYAMNQQNQPVVNQQGQRQVQALQMPVARVEMVNARSGGLNKKAVQTLNSMSKLAVKENADMEVYVPASDEMYSNAIRGVVNPYNDPNGPKVFLQRDIAQYFIVLKPRG